MIAVVTVANTSTIVVQENPKGIRQRLYLVNSSDENIDVAPGEVAIVGRGIILFPGGNFTDQPDHDGWIYQGVYTAICVSGGKTMGVTELNRS